MRSNILTKISKFFIYIAPLTLFIVYQGSIFPFIVGKYVFFRTIIELALVFFVWAWATDQFDFDESYSLSKKDKRSQMSDGALRIPTKVFLKSPIVIAVGVFVLIFLFATFFGINPSASFWSNFERGEGSLQVLILFIFFLLLVSLFQDEASWRRIFLISVWVAGFVIAYGILGNVGIMGFIGSAPANTSFLYGFCYRFAGSLGNPAYLGTYMIFAIFYSLYLFLNPRRENSKKWMFLVLAFIFFLFLLFSQTRGALLGLSVAVFVSLIYLVIYLPVGLARKISFFVLVFGIILAPLAIIYRHDINIQPFCPAEIGGGSRILDVSTDSETLQTRFILWGQAIKAFKERPILGWGPENFSTAFEKYFDTRHTAWFDRAHNIFFDYLVFSGALGLLSFIGIFVVFFIVFLKFNKKNNKDAQRRKGYAKQSALIENRALYEKALILSLPVAYLVQGLVLFDVLPIYINIFLFLAIANYKFVKELKSRNEKYSG